MLKTVLITAGIALAVVILYGMYKDGKLKFGGASYEAAYERL